MVLSNCSSLSDDSDSEAIASPPSICATIDLDVDPLRPSIGRALAGARVYVLDARMAPVPFLYSRGPSGWHSYAVHVGSDGVLKRIEQRLTVENVKKVAANTWTKNISTSSVFASSIPKAAKTCPR